MMLEPSSSGGNSDYTIKEGYGDATVTIHDRPPPSPPLPPSPAGDTVTLHASNAYAAEIAAEHRSGLSDLGEFTISRGEGNTAGRLVVLYVLDGELSTATAPGDAEHYPDYEENLVPLDAPYGAFRYGAVAIEDGKSSVTVRITPVNDSDSEWDEAVRLTLLQFNPAYPTYPLSYVVDPAWHSATVTILDDDGVSGFLNRNVDTESTGLTKEVISNGVIDVGVQQGQVALALSLAPGGLHPVYRGDDNLHPILSVDWELPGSTKPAELKATLNFTGQPGLSGPWSSPKVTLDIADAQVGDPWRIVLLGPEDIAAQLSSGHYDYDIALSAVLPTGTQTRTIRGGTEIVNRVDPTLGWTEFGKRWSLDGLDRLVPGDGTTARLTDQGLAAFNGTALIRGDNTSAWYVSPLPAAYQVFDQPSATGWEDGTLAGGYAGNYLKKLGGGEITWNITDVADTRVYQVFATWVPAPTRPDDAYFTIEGATRATQSSGQDTMQIMVNQQFTAGELVVDGTGDIEGIRWRSLGYYIPDGNTLQVTLHAGTAGETVADAIMLVSDWDYVTPDGSFNRLFHGPISVDEDDYYVETGYVPEDGSYTLATKFGTRYEFDHQGLLQRAVDRNGNTAEYAYQDKDSDGRADELVGINVQGLVDDNPATYTYTFEYAGDYLSRITDFAGRAASFTMADGLLTEITQPDPDITDTADPPKTIFAYVTVGSDTFLETIDNAETHQTKITYDPSLPGDPTNYRVVSVTNPDSIDPDPAVPNSPGEDLRSWQITPLLVDGLGQIRRPVPTRVPQGGDALAIPAPETTGTSTFIQARAMYTDPRTNGWIYQTDEFGLLTALGAPTTSSSRDVHTRLGITETDPDFWHWLRNPHGLVTDSVEPAGGGGDRAATNEAPLPKQKTTRQYTEKYYDLQSISYPDGSSESWLYDSRFHLPIRHTDQLSRVTEWKRDTSPYGNVVKQIEPAVQIEGGSQQFQKRITLFSEYTAKPAAGDLAALPGGLILSMTEGYATTNPDWDPAQYDARDAVTTSTTYYQPGNTAVGLPYQVFSAHGTTIETVVTYTYQNRNLASVTDPVFVSATDPDVRKTQYVYDTLDRLQGLVSPKPETGSIDPADPAICLTDSSTCGPTTRYVYDKVGNPTQVTDPRGQSTDYTYDGMGRLRTTTYPAAGGDSETPQDRLVLEYVYDAGGNLLKEIEHLDGVSDDDGMGADDRVTTYRYDERNLRDSTLLADPFP